MITVCDKVTSDEENKEQDKRFRKVMLGEFGTFKEGGLGRSLRRQLSKSLQEVSE